MGKYLFEYANNAAYAAEIKAGRKKIDIEYATRLKEFKKKLDAAADAPEDLETVFALDAEFAEIERAHHGQLIGLVNRTYTKYRIEDERLAEAEKKRSCHV